MMSSSTTATKEIHMSDVQVTCVTKTGTTHQTITHLGGTGGTGWKWTKQQVVNSINDNTNTFYTLVNGKRANIYVIKGTPDYVQTAADGAWSNNLLALPTCP
jgi:hypothetical protein